MESVLTETEKRKIEEKIRYEEEIRKKIERENKNSLQYKDDMTDADIQHVVLPQMDIACEITGHIKMKEKESEKLSQNICACEIEKKQFPSNSRILMVVLGIIIFCVYLILDGEYSNIPGYQFMCRLDFLFIPLSVILQFVWKLPGALFVLIIFSYPFFVGFAAILIGRIIRFVLRKRKLDKEISRLKGEIAEIQEYIEKYYRDNYKLLTFLPDNYHNFDATSHIRELFMTHRATSFKEAFNIYEKDYHNKKIESNVENMKESVNAMTDSVGDLAGALRGFRK